MESGSPLARTDNPGHYKVVYLHHANFSPTEFYRDLAWSLGLVPKLRRSDLCRQIAATIIEAIFQTAKGNMRLTNRIALSALQVAVVNRLSGGLLIADGGMDDLARSTSCAEVLLNMIGE